jgi:hypothetical protein
MCQSLRASPEFILKIHAYFFNPLQILRREEKIIMEKQKTYKQIAMACNAAAVLSCLMIILSMFMPYLNIKAGTVFETIGTGWKYLTNKNTGSGKITAYLVLTLIFALGVGVLAILRLLRFPLFNTKLLALIYTLAALALLVLSVLTFTSFKNSSPLDITKHGIGLIVNLIFSITAMLSALGGAAVYALSEK